MKPLLLFFGGALLAGGVSAGVTVLLVQGPGAAHPTAAANLRTPVSPTQTGGDVEALRGELAMLTRTVGELQAELGTLKSSALRQPLPAGGEVVTPESLAAAGLTPVQIEERMLGVIAAEREREDLEEQARRDERERAGAERQAERIAKELGLGGADQARLAEHLVVSGQKRRELFEGMRDGGFDRDAMRASMDELRTWNTDQLYRTFNPAVAAQLDEMAGDVFGGGRGGFGGGGQRRGGGGGGGGGGNGGNGNPPGGG